MAAVNSDSMAAAVKEILDAYGIQVRNAVETAVQKTADEARKLVARAGDYEDRTGRYRKGFYSRKGDAGYVGSVYRVGNRRYRLSHLLEKPHRIGKAGMTRAFPHFAPAAEYAGKRLPIAVKEELEKQ